MKCSNGFRVSHWIWHWIGFGSNIIITLFVFLTLFAFVHCSNAQYSDACRSIEGKLGTCVRLSTCPLFSSWLKQRPLVKEKIRLVIQFTCFFDRVHPKVCCPNDNLYPNQLEEVGIRLGGFAREAKPHPNRLVFPTSTLTFPLASAHRKNPQSPTQDNEASASSNATPLNHVHVPLSFPNEESEGRKLFNNKESSSVVQNDFRHHPNFRLIPRLAQCSNAVKLDSLFGTYGTYPWLALVGFKRRRSLDFDHVCAGTIINDRHIITAAHCFGSANPRYVRLGEYNLETLIDQGSEFLPQTRREDFHIEERIIHPDYNPSTFANDIALIRVDRRIPLNTTFIRAACLPFMKEYDIENKLDVNNVEALDGKSAWVAGWAHHSWDGLYSSGSHNPILQEGFVEFTSHDKCRRDHSRLSPLNSHSQFCVGGKGRRNSCASDSGGPLMIPLKVPSSKVPGFVEPKFFVLGLLSHGPTGNACQNNNNVNNEGGDEGRSLSTSVFTRIAKYLSWILDNMKE